MPIESPPSFLQAGSYSAEQLRRTISSLLARGSGVGTIAGGVVAGGDCTVTAGANTGVPNVNVGVGEMWIPGTQAVTPQAAGGYYARVTGPTNVILAPASSSNPRNDMIVATVTDAAYTGTSNQVVLQAVQGTATSGATLANAAGIGALPPNSIEIALVNVPAGATSLSSSNIGMTISTITIGVGLTVAAGSVGTAQLANQGVTSAKIANGAVGSSQLATGAVTSTQVGAGVPIITYSTTFPSGAKLGDECFRADIDTWYKFDGSNWYAELIPSAWVPIGAAGTGGATYFSGWQGSMRARREGDIIRLSGQLNNNGASGGQSTACFIVPFGPPASSTTWFTQVMANANPVLFSIQNGQYGTTVAIDAYSEATFAGSGFCEFEGCTYSLT
jgi:hypothetical protein